MRARLVRNAVLPILVVAAVLGYLVHERREHREYRAKVAAFVNELSLEQRDGEYVRKLASQSRFSGLRLRDESSELWTVETPLEFGAGNWWVFLTLKDSKVTGIRVRTEDSIEDHPTDAPPDKTF